VFALGCGSGRSGGHSGSKGDGAGCRAGSGCDGTGAGFTSGSTGGASGPLMQLKIDTDTLTNSFGSRIQMK